MRSRLALLSCATLALAAPAAHAKPVLVPVQGTLGDADGGPIDDTLAVTFGLYDDATGGDPWWTESQTVTFDVGLFTAYLGSVASLDDALFALHATAWLGVKVGSGAELGRIRVGHAPLAAAAENARHADDAGTVGGIAATDLRKTATKIPWSDLSNVPADLADGDQGAAYTAGDGIDITAGAISVDPSAVEGWARGVCPDTTAELSALLDAVYLRATAHLPWSQVDGVPASLADGDQDTTYSPGTGLALTGTTFSVDATQIADWSKAACFDTAPEVRAALGGVHNAEEYPGATAGDRIQAAINALPATGGTVDARGLSGEQVLHGLTIDKPVTLLLGHATYTLDGAIVVNATDSVALIGSGGDRTKLVRKSDYLGKEKYLVWIPKPLVAFEMAGLTFDNGDPDGGPGIEGGVVIPGYSAIMLLRGASDRVHIHDNAFMNQGTTHSIYFDRWDTEGRDILVDHNYFESATAKFNGQAIYVGQMGQSLRVNNNTVVRSGGFSLRPGYKGFGERRVEVSGNHFQDCDATNILVRTTQDQIVESIVITNNQFENAGRTIGKGLIAVENDYGNGAVQRMVITSNVGRGWGFLRADAPSIGISIAGYGAQTAMGEILIADNILDGRTPRTADGKACAPDGCGIVGQGYGIVVRETSEQFVIHDNIIRNTGRSGIMVSHSSNGDIHDNIVLKAVQDATAVDPTPAGQGGIHIDTAVRHVAIHHNRVIDPGTAAARSNGVFLQSYGAVPIDDVVVAHNHVQADLLDASLPPMSQTIAAGIAANTPVGAVRLVDNDISTKVATAVSGVAVDYLRAGAPSAVTQLAPAMDRALLLYVNAGVDAKQWSGFALQDRGATAWQLGKDEANRFVVKDAANARERLALTPDGDTVIDHGAAADAHVVVHDLVIEGVVTGPIHTSSAADESQFVFVDAGKSTPQWAATAYQDRGTTRWLVGKDNMDRYVIQDGQDGGLNRAVFDPKGSTIITHGTTAGSRVFVDDVIVRGGLEVAANGDNPQWLFVDSGAAAAQWNGLALRDRTATKWLAGKDDQNRYVVHSVADAAAHQLRVLMNPTGSSVFSHGSTPGSKVVVDDLYAKGDATVDGSLRAGAAADSGQFVFVDSGAAAEQWSGLSLWDRGSPRWLVGKDTVGRFLVQDALDGALNRLQLDAKGSTVITHGTTPGSVVAVDDLSVRGGLHVGPTADADQFLFVDSGTSAAAWSGISLWDRSAPAWLVGKDPLGRFQVQTAGSARLLMDPTGSTRLTHGVAGGSKVVVDDLQVHGAGLEVAANGDNGQWVFIDSGASAPQWGGFVLRDRGVNAWLTGKNDSGSYVVQSSADDDGAKTRILMDAKGSTVLTHGTTGGSVVMVTDLRVDGGVSKIGSGMKHVRVGTGTVGSGAFEATVTWPTAFPDASYTVTCVAYDEAEGDGLTVLRIKQRTAGVVKVQMANQAAAPRSGEIDCTAMHD